jgi:hypothetical protein
MATDLKEKAVEQLGDIVGQGAGAALVSSAAGKVAAISAAKASAAALATKTAGTAFAPFAAAKVASLAGLKAGALTAALSGPLAPLVAPVGGVLFGLTVLATYRSLRRRGR